jgi:hypothetical protein
MTLLPILLPEGFSLKVSAGDKITAGQVIAEGQDKIHEEIIPIAHQLKLVPKKAIGMLKKNLGDSIEVGDILAVKKSMLSSQKVISEFSGTLVKIDEETGDLTVRTNQSGGNLKTIAAPADGIVESCDEKQIVLKTEKQAIVAIDGIGGDSEGQIEYLADSDENKLGLEIKGKILLTKNINRIYLFKTVGLEAAGIITEELEDIDFIDLEEKHVRMPVLKVSEEDFKKLTKEKKVYLFGKNKSIVIE